MNDRATRLEPDDFGTSHDRGQTVVSDVDVESVPCQGQPGKAQGQRIEVAYSMNI